MSADQNNNSKNATNTLYTNSTQKSARTPAQHTTQTTSTASTGVQKAPAYPERNEPRVLRRVCGRPDYACLIGDPILEGEDDGYTFFTARQMR